jgi:hypothetical protein
MREMHAANSRGSGYPMTWKALRRPGEQVPHCRAQRLMPRHGTVGAKRRGTPWRRTFRTPRRIAGSTLVQRNFAVDAPDPLWVADLSHLRGGRAGLRVRRGRPLRRVVGW